MKKVAVIFGGMSSEHEISCLSVTSILNNINKKKYEVDKIGITKGGKWFKYIGSIDKIKECKWEQDENNIYIKDVISFLKKYDVVFPVLHGKYGEDGTVQGILEFANVKYVGCKVLGSAIAMDKIMSKKIASLNGIRVTDYIDITKGKYDISKIKQDVLEKLGYPVIVKPSREGSSFGVSKVESELSLKEKIEYAFLYDNEILIEKYIDDRIEVECAALEIDGKLHISTPGQINSANEFYDFNAKYENSNSSIKIPANIWKEKLEKIKKYAKLVFECLKLNMISRIDFFVSKDNIYFNEVNTIPGFTDISMYPKMLEYDGISFEKLLDILLNN